MLYQLLGDYAKAEPLYQRAYKIREKALGPEHPDTADESSTTWDYFTAATGRLCESRGSFSNALSRISEKALGPNIRTTAKCLSNLAMLITNYLGDYAKAEPLCQRALEDLARRLSALSTPTWQTALNNLGFLYHQQGEYAKAKPLFERAFKISEKALGPDHPYHCTGSRKSGDCRARRLDKHAEARTVAQQLRKSQLKMLSNVLSFCSEPQRLAYQNTMIPYTLFAAIDGSDSELASACLRYKGVVLDSIIEDRLLAERSENKEDQDLVERLNADKQRLGQLLLETPKVSTDQNTKQIQQLEQEVEQIEGKLARNVAGLGRPRRALAVTVEEVQAVIPEDGALIEYVWYPHYLGKGKIEPRYGAIVLTAKGKPRWIPIGRADEIEKRIMRYRNQVCGPGNRRRYIQENVAGIVRPSLDACSRGSTR